MQLSVLDRVHLLQLLPNSGNLVMVRMLHRLRERLGFTPEELAECGIVTDQVNGRIRWTKDKIVDVVFHDTEKDLFITTLRELDRTSKLTVGLLPLYDRFVENGKVPAGEKHGD